MMKLQKITLIIFCIKSQTNGIQLVIEVENKIVAEIHCYKLEPLVF